MRTRRTAPIAAGLPLLLLACSVNEAPGPLLDPDLAWYGDNAARLEEAILEIGVRGDRYDAAQPPVAVFDWDNTVIKNDVGDITVFWMLNHNLVLQPPGRDWSQVSAQLTPAAVAGLGEACDTQGEPGEPLLTDQDSGASRACADAILAAYHDGLATTGEDAFRDGETETLEPAYGLAVQLQAGYTGDEIRAFATAARDAALGEPVGATQQVGSGAYNADLRVYDQMRDLIGALQDSGVEVWIVSASSQFIVEPFAAEVGVAPDHVIGVRATLDDEGRAETTFQGCGTFADGNSELITFRQGKRCWINQEIFGVSDGAAQLDEPSPLAVTAGDSPTDLWMLRDARTLRLVINRNKTELMCRAYANADGRWLINPMFIEPKAERTDGYACGEYGLPDQKDTVF